MTQTARKEKEEVRARKYPEASRRTFKTNPDRQSKLVLWFLPMQRINLYRRRNIIGKDLSEIKYARNDR